MSPGSGKRPRIVVGVDGSPESLAALRWAIAQAAVTGGTVDAVTAWRLPTALTGYGLAPVAVADRPWMEHTARLVLGRAIAEVTGTGQGPAIRGRLVHGFAPHALLKAASGADLLVVGSRGSGGSGGLTGARLGSVSLSCLRRACCPVVVVPDRRTAAGNHDPGTTGMDRKKVPAKGADCL